MFRWDVTFELCLYLWGILPGRGNNISKSMKVSASGGSQARISSVKPKDSMQKRPLII